MTMHARVSGTWQPVTALSARVSGVWQPVRTGYVRVSGVWQVFYSTVMSLINSGDLYTSRSGAGSSTSAAVTATVSGGNPGYTYLWTRVSGDTYTINSSGSASTTFSTTLGAAQFKTGVYRCTVTDSTSATASTDVIVEFESF